MKDVNLRIIMLRRTILSRIKLEKAVLVTINVTSEKDQSYLEPSTKKKERKNNILKKYISL